MNNREGHQLGFTVSFCVWFNNKHRHNVESGHLFRLFLFFIQRCQVICNLQQTHKRSNSSQCHQLQEQIHRYPLNSRDQSEKTNDLS